MKRVIAIIVLVVAVPAVAWAEKKAERVGPKSVPAPAVRSTTEKRAWLRDQVAKGLQDPRQVRELQQKVDRMNPQQIDALAAAVLAQQQPQANPEQALAQAQQELARAQQLRQLLENELWLRRAAVGYAPVITWLPQGAGLGASAVISPDGRYVRTNVTPFFSSIGPVYTYNMYTGETRLMPQYPQPYFYGYPQYGYGAGASGQMFPQQPPPQPKLRSWYDGARTRIGR